MGNGKVFIHKDLKLDNILLWVGKDEKWKNKQVSEDEVMDLFIKGDFECVVSDFGLVNSI